MAKKAMFLVLCLNLMFISKVTGEPIHSAAEDGNVAELQRLIEAGADINSVVSNYGNTPLHVAAAGAHTDAVKFIVEIGADVDTPNQGSFTAFALAAQAGDTESMAILIEHGATVDGNPGAVATPLYLASSDNQLDAVNKLISRQANLDRGNTIDGASPLLIAAARGYSPIVEALISNGADVNAKRNDGAYGLTLAAEFGFVEIVEYFLHSSQTYLTVKVDGFSAEDLARRKGHSQIVEMIQVAIDSRRASFDSQETVTQVQSKLSNLGFNVGTIDGLYGMKTRDALLKFQAGHNILETGIIDQPTLIALEIVVDGNQERPVESASTVGPDVVAVPPAWLAGDWVYYTYSLVNLGSLRGRGDLSLRVERDRVYEEQGSRTRAWTDFQANRQMITFRNSTGDRVVLKRISNDCLAGTYQTYISGVYADWGSRTLTRRGMNCEFREQPSEPLSFTQVLP